MRRLFEAIFHIKLAIFGFLSLVNPVSTKRSTVSMDGVATTAPRAEITTTDIVANGFRRI